MFPVSRELTLARLPPDCDPRVHPLPHCGRGWTKPERFGG